MSLLNLFDELDKNTIEKTREKVIKAPFGYPGGKSKSVDKILDKLPYTNTYIEPFGGSAAIMLARKPSKLEVFNDRYAGVTSFYRCLRDKNKMRAMIAWLEMTVHSREEFICCRDTWENCEDDIERAARWYYMTRYSFAQIGRNFGRGTCKVALNDQVRDKLKLFPIIHERLKNVQIENQDYYAVIQDYDNETAVFYCDPPYVDSHVGAYKHIMSIDDHRRFLDLVFGSKGFFAVSGYSNPLYENQKWEGRFEWEVSVTLSPRAFTENNYKRDVSDLDKRTTATEVLWIKESG